MILDTNKPQVNDIFWINNGDNTVHVIEKDNDLFAAIHFGDSRSPITERLFLSAEKSYAEQGFKIWIPDTIFTEDELLP
ncbi:hypothetical protein [Enterococcus wangshanyuanii]|uniref:Uncharacterized protein n=1 Tax=Enterococcus wangshanyuanii TaxID=2005703 RepID=A0ABQ1P858_9ENTE|nr:hypothetical protein [Enterococcus wangshanyuanii]GGC92727.1 hypothetical protein GCM10011573_22920 [Enterococcus wangshanyuanii]